MKGILFVVFLLVLTPGAAMAGGLEPSAVYDGEPVANVLGGERRGARYSGSLRLQLAIDAERALGWRGLSLFATGLQTHGHNPSELVGDAQGVSNLAAPNGVQLYELWLQQNLLDNRISTLFGRYDLGTEFYRLQSAALFVNSSFGMGPEMAQSGQGGPSIYPNPALGARLALKPARGVVARFAVLDGVPLSRAGDDHVPTRGDGLLLVAEQAFLLRSLGHERTGNPRLRIGRNSGLSPYRHKIALGGWTYTARFDDVNVTRSNRDLRHIGSSGAYLIADTTLAGTADGRRQLSAFGQLGIGDARVNRFGAYLGGGVVMAGLWSVFTSDELGLAAALARNGSHYLELQRRSALPVRNFELAFELTYLMQLGQHLAVQPDVQYVLWPGTDPNRNRALGLGLRFELHT